MAGSWWQGRSLRWNPDEQAVEQERQRWVYEKLTDHNKLINDLLVDPQQAYAEHRQEYIRTGDLYQLEWMLSYVQPEPAI